ncbi:hypothetical protein [Octadecabacter sp. R77987]|uniref:hypothetical protein n=1 Tax=Octadecabacter sp. R77987 TaxID=3093874 RepID=UPI0036719892
MTIGPVSLFDRVTSNQASGSAYLIHDFEQHFSETESPFEVVRLIGLLVDQTDLIRPTEASDALFSVGHSSQDRIWHMLGVLKRLDGSDADKVGFFKEHWSSTDDTYQYGGTVLYELKNLSSSEHFWSHLVDDEKAWMSSLGHRFTVYRGCDESRVDGVSWTTDRNVAESFAFGHRSIRNPSPVIVSAECHKCNVLLAVNDRDEFEVIVDPSMLENIWVTPFR